MADLVTTPPTRLGAFGHGSRRVWRRWRDRLASVFLPLLTLAAALGAWEAWVRLDHVPRYIMAPFSTVIQIDYHQRGFLLSQAWITLYEALLGFGLAIGAGVALALLIDSSWRVEQALWPFLVASQVMPVVAFAPIIIVWFGFGLSPKVLIVALLGTFLVTIECVAGLKSLEDEKLLLCRSIGASRFQVYAKVKLPQALPNLFTGLKLASMLALTGAVVAEFISSQNGLGHYVIYEGDLPDPASATAGVLYLIVMGLALYSIVDLVERFAIPWHTSKRIDSSGAG